MTDLVTVGAFTLSGAAIGALGQALAQWVGQSKQRERERTAELRRALAEFVAASDAWCDLFYSLDKAPSPGLPPEKRLAAMEAKSQQYAQLPSTAISLRQIAMKCFLLERNKERRTAINALVDRLLGLNEAYRTNMATGHSFLQTLSKDMAQWVDQQAERRDL